MGKVKLLVRNVPRILLGIIIGFVGISGVIYISEYTLPRFFSQPATGLISPVSAELSASTVPQVQLPVRMVIPKISVTLPIKSAQVVGNNWDTYDDAISYLVSSASPFASGNSVFYGHNRPGVLENIYKLQINDEIIIDSKEGSKTFVVYDKKEVKPNDLSLITEVDNRISLYTCSGFFDSKRLFVLARPK